MGALGLVGDGIEGHGCPPMSPMASGLVNMELNRGDGSLGTFLGVAVRTGHEVLASTRNAVTWGGLGHATAAYEIALSYSQQREQCGRPLASFQLVQDTFVLMRAEVTAMQLYCLRLAQLSELGQLTDTMASLAKLNNTREVLLAAREVLGGNGILLDDHVMRHLTDIEAPYTYEGTADIQELIIGREITGISATA